MENQALKIGDRVYHLSNSRISWVIEKIENDLVFCSTLFSSGELKENKFKITSVVKIAERSISVIKPKPQSNW